MIFTKKIQILEKIFFLFIPFDFFMHLLLLHKP